MDDRKALRLYERALAIQEGRARGLWVPIAWHLALRCDPLGMTLLAIWLSGTATRESLGKPADAFSAAGLYRRAWRRGNETAAQNLAMSHFNMRDLAGYRHWLRKAARAGSVEERLELRRFETRLPHETARRLRRQRPFRRSELRSWR